ncbi:MAG: hypothetical protein LBQ57_03440 [Spirochaetales bacterium]|jgi:hypothetical protein|nr:hypothetical protein [Spirochaetales bacterium]
MFKKILAFPRKLIGYITEINRTKATDMMSFEVNEMENLFAILLFGSFMGLPAPPAAMAIELLPYMENELRLMVSRADFAQDAIASVMDILHVD